MIFIIILMWLGFVALVVVASSSKAASVMLHKRIEALTETEKEMLRDPDELQASLAARTVIPWLQNIGDKASEKAQGLGGAETAELLEQAGHPFGMGVREFMGLKVVCVVAFLGLGIFGMPVVLMTLEHIPAVADKIDKLRLLFLGLAVMLPMFGFIFPTFALRKIVRKRHSQIKKQLPDVVDLICLGIEAGLGFDGAVGETIMATQGPITEELTRVMGEITMGKDRSDAFRGLAERTKMAELSLLVAAIEQAEKMGVGLGKAMKQQSTELRERRRMWAKEQAAKLPVKMMIPLVLFIFPALFVVILGPAVVQVVEMMKSGLF